MGTRGSQLADFLNFSALSTNLSVSCSTALNATTAFMSTRFISPRYDEAEEETKHDLMKKYQYRNYMIDGEISQPMLGLGIEHTATLVNQLLQTGSHVFSVGNFHLLTM